MPADDDVLGMHRDISRRDFLNGASIAVGAALLPGCSGGEDGADPAALYYPPAETGLRGAHPGSFEVAHALVQGNEWRAETSAENYDLIVVGAGISGLSAAYIYRRDVDPDARILILDNHDDFGGHAKRNEFTLDGRTLLGFGGTMNMTAPNSYPEVAKQVIGELGIDPGRYDEFHDEDLFGELGLHSGVFFDKETFGVDHLGVATGGLETVLADAPLAAASKAELLRLFKDEEDYLAGMSPRERRAVLETHSWRDYLEKFAGMGEESLRYLQKRSHGNWCIGADALPAWAAWADDYPGFADMDIGFVDESEGDNGGRSFYFPDGNASVARSLVRKLVPDVAPGSGMESIVTAQFDYSALDRDTNAARVRLSSTVVTLRHQDGDLGGDIDVTYVKDGRAKTISAARVIWAGYHAMLPYVCPDVPRDQVAAQTASVRSPLVYTNVLIRNWTSFANLGVSRVYCPGSFFQSIRVNRPMSIGEYRFPSSPDEPMVLHLQHMPLEQGLPAAEQFRAGRRRLLETPFATFERNVRDQLGRLLRPGGFDPARDIAAITVNRWPHGYAYSMDPESGDVAWWPEFWSHEGRPWEEARQRVGNLAIAGTDAASNAMTESAIQEAHRAVMSFAG